MKYVQDTHKAETGHPHSPRMTIARKDYLKTELLIFLTVVKFGGMTVMGSWHSSTKQAKSFAGWMEHSVAGAVTTVPFKLHWGALSH